MLFISDVWERPQLLSLLRLWPDETILPIVAGEKPLVLQFPPMLLAIIEFSTVKTESESTITAPSLLRFEVLLAIVLFVIDKLVNWNRIAPPVELKAELLVALPAIVLL